MKLEQIEQYISQKLIPFFKLEKGQTLDIEIFDEFTPEKPSNSLIKIFQEDYSVEHFDCMISYEDGIGYHLKVMPSPRKVIRVRNPSGEFVYVENTCEEDLDYECLAIVAAEQTQLHTLITIKL